MTNMPARHVVSTTHKTHVHTGSDSDARLRLLELRGWMMVEAAAAAVGHGSPPSSFKMFEMLFHFFLLFLSSLARFYSQGHGMPVVDVSVQHVTLSPTQD